MNSRMRALLMTRAGKTALSIVAIWGLTLVAAAQAEAPPHSPNDLRVFKAVACSKDRSPVEALYYIAANRSDLDKGLASPTSTLMKEEVDSNWRQIAARLTKDEMMEERFTELYNAVLSEYLPQLQQVVKEKSGVSLYVTEVNSRLMNAKDKDFPACHAQQAG